MSESTSHYEKYFAERPVFEQAVQDAVALAKQTALWWRLSAGGGLAPRLDEQQLEKYFAARLDDRKRFEKVLGRDITFHLEILALNRPRIDALVAIGGPSFALSESEAADFDARAALVEERLLTDELRQRVTIRKTCKGPSLEDVRWDISIKKHDMEAGPIADIPYATIEFVLSKDPVDFRVPQVLRFLAGGTREVFAFDCHAEDLDALIRDLDILRSNLRELQTAHR